VEAPAEVDGRQELLVRIQQRLRLGLEVLRERHAQILRAGARQIAAELRDVGIDGDGRKRRRIHVRRHDGRRVGARRLRNGPRGRACHEHAGHQQHGGGSADRAVGERTARGDVRIPRPW
jgi:hypothetical protein